MIIETDCPDCNGIGRVMRGLAGRYGDPMDPGKECDQCGGTGRISFDSSDFAQDDEDEPTAA